MTITRAQEALARPGEHVTALRKLFGRLLAQEQTFRAIAEEITDVDVCYEMGADQRDPHPMLGKWVPNLTLHVEHGTTHVAQLMSAGRGVLLDLADRSALRDVARKCADRVEVTSAHCYERPANLDAILVRPDGYVAWALRSNYGENESKRTLRAALEKWFGAAR